MFLVLLPLLDQQMHLICMLFGKDHFPGKTLCLKLLLGLTSLHRGIELHIVPLDV